VIHVDLQGNIATLRLEHGKANALDLELLQGLSDSIRRARATGARAAVIIGTGGIFCAGVDLFRVVNGGEAYARAFVPALADVLTEVFACPMPLVAAVNGHAIAGGCILVCACDHRVMAEGKGTIGMPELLVGVPFPMAAIEIIRQVVPSHELQRLVYTGRVCPPAEAVARGLIDEVTPADQLLGQAIAAAERLASVPSDVFAATKRTLRGAALERLQLDTTRAEVVDTWAAAETRAHIQEYLNRGVVKKS
jgi:enoyl-CoA hydratase